MKKKKVFFGFLVVLAAGAFFFAAWGEYQVSPRGSDIMRAAVSSAPVPLIP